MKKNIAIISGGDSSEYEISINSAKQIKENLNSDLFNSYPVVIRGDNWYYEENPEIKIDKNDFSLNLKEGKIKFDCIFNIIHGTPGEDGKLQGYFDTLNLPYTSPDVITSSLTFNKFMCKSYLRNFEIPMAKSVWIVEGDVINEEKILQEVGLPCFVKPNNGGSSFGISKVTKAEELKSAIKSAFEEDNQIIIEEFIDGSEVTCGLFLNGINNLILPLCEVVSENDFFDYEAKYTVGKAQEIVPARVSTKVELDVKKLSEKIYKALNCKGLVRVDFIVKNEKPYFLEINTVPGMSAESIVPKMIRANGMKISDVLTFLIEETLK